MARGGFGNLTHEATTSLQEKRRAPGDLEAQTPLSGETGSRGPREYAHSGRGGAGNYYSPARLQQSGTFETTSGDEPKSSSGNSTPARAPYRGRGGAGNYVFAPDTDGSAQEAVERGRDQREREDKARGDAARDVEASLAKPGRAYIGPAKDGLQRNPGNPD